MNRAVTNYYRSELGTGNMSTNSVSSAPDGRTMDGDTHALLQPPACLLCGAMRHRVVFREFEIDVLCCQSCGHVFSSHHSDEHYTGFWGAEVEQADSYWSNQREPMYSEFRRRFTDGRRGRLLDMGSGLGFFARGIASSPGWEAYGCEISPAGVRYARERLLLANIICSPLEEVELPSSSFDIITMWDVLDHLPNPDPVLARCHSLLANDGFLFMRTPNIRMQLLRARLNRRIKGMRRGVTYLSARDHAHFYSAESLRRLLARNGFKELHFVHLRPVNAPGGGKHQRMKDAWFLAVRTLSAVSGGRFNFDNLFVVARK